MENLTSAYWQNLAKNIEFRNQAFINGEFTNSQSEGNYDVINPATEKVLA